MKTRYVLLGIALVAFLATQPLGAIDANETLNVSATVNAKARLELSSNSVSFPDADPETVLSIPASGGPINVTAKARTGAASNVTLTLQAGGNLVNAASDEIAITNVTWVGGGAGYANGTMNTSAQSVGAWVGSGVYAGTMTFALANSWTYATGSYSATATFTLTAP